MFQQYKTPIQKYGLFFLTLLLLVITVFLFYLDLKSWSRGFTFAMLDIGQGDALFIESPTGTQILVDGGPPRKISGQLAQVMSPFDRHLDASIITNPDQDHMGGFLDVLKVYKVDKVFESGTRNDSKIYQNLKEEIKNKNIQNIQAEKGMRLHLGGGVVLDVLFPDRDVSAWSPNDGSIVMKLSYGKISIMLTGDSTARTEQIVLDEFSERALKSTVLKVPHHGSRTSSSAPFVQAISPDYALISNGENNKYGHPHQETLDTLTQLGAEIFRTDLLGTIILKSDGENIEFSFKK